MGRFTFVVAILVALLSRPVFGTAQPEVITRAAMKACLELPCAPDCPNVGFFEDSTTVYLAGLIAERRAYANDHLHPTRWRASSGLDRARELFEYAEQLALVEGNVNIVRQATLGQVRRNSLYLLWHGRFCVPPRMQPRTRRECRWLWRPDQDAEAVYLFDLVSRAESLHAEEGSSTPYRLLLLMEQRCDGTDSEYQMARKALASTSARPMVRIEALMTRFFDDLNVDAAYGAWATKWTNALEETFDGLAQTTATTHAEAEAWTREAKRFHRLCDTAVTWNELDW